MSKKTLHTYEVTLRRDVQQVTCMRVTASSRQDAIVRAEESVSYRVRIEEADTAESLADSPVWSIEKHLGTHRPKVQLQRHAPIKGRTIGKSDRRTGTDRRADKRRVSDKARARIAARNMRK